MISGAARVAPEKAVFRPALPMSFLPGIAEMHMEKLSWSDQYKHPNWQKKRLEVMQDAGFQCENCGDKDTTLNVHHKRYVKGRMVWEYERVELECLCEDCHRTEHENRARLDLLLMASGASLGSVVALLAGYFEGSLNLDTPPVVSDEFSAEFELGILTSILACQMPDALLRAHFGGGVTFLNPVQREAVERWRLFAERLEKSGL